MGSNESTSTSRPLTGAERQDAYYSGISSMFGSQGPTKTYGEFLAGMVTDNRDPNNANNQAHYQNYLASRETANASAKTVSDMLGSLKYTSPKYTAAEPAKTLTNGDYDRLETNIFQSRGAPLLRQFMVDSEALDADLNKRGIYSSGLAVRAQNDLRERYLPQYRAAASEAAAQRYGMQSDELEQLNARAVAEANARNAFAMDNAGKEYDSQWRKPDYLAGLWNGTGGAISSGVSGGWSI